MLRVHAVTDKSVKTQQLSDLGAAAFRFTSEHVDSCCVLLRHH